MDSWKLEAVRPWMQFLELVGTLSRGEDEKHVSVALDRKKCRFFVCFDEIVDFLTEITI